MPSLGFVRVCVLLAAAAALTCAFVVVPHVRPHSFCGALHMVGRDDSLGHKATHMSPTLQDHERLQKVLSRAGVTSRRDAEKMIADGRVHVNGKIVTELGTKVRPVTDVIKVDGKQIEIPTSSELYWIAYNKPKGVLCTMSDEKGRTTVLEMIPQARNMRLVPVGRLDRDSTGLMLLTNDNGWIHVLTHPSFGHRKKYRVIVEGIPDADALQQLKAGLKLPDETTRCLPVPATVLDIHPDGTMCALEMILAEGRNRQIRRMMDFLGHPVTSIKRTEFGPLKLGWLRPGQWRILNPIEVLKLKNVARGKIEKPAAVVSPADKEKLKMVANRVGRFNSANAPNKPLADSKLNTGNARGRTSGTASGTGDRAGLVSNQMRTFRRR